MAMPILKVTETASINANMIHTTLSQITSSFNPNRRRNFLITAHRWELSTSWIVLRIRGINITWSRLLLLLSRCHRCRCHRCRCHRCRCHRCRCHRSLSGSSGSCSCRRCRRCTIAVIPITSSIIACTVTIEITNPSSRATWRTLSLREGVVM